MPRWTGEPYTVELFDEPENRVHVLSQHGTLDSAREAYAAALKGPRRANEVVLLCWKAQTLKRSDRSDQ